MPSCAYAESLSSQAGMAATNELTTAGSVSDVGHLPEALALQVARVHHLLELVLERDGEHRLVEEHRLAHQGEPAARDDASRRGQVVDEARLAEGTEAQVALGVIVG